MPSEVNAHEARVQRFRSDLKMLKPNEVIRKHITTGMPVELTDEIYFAASQQDRRRVYAPSRTAVVIVDPAAWASA